MTFDKERITTSESSKEDGKLIGRTSDWPFSETRVWERLEDIALTWPTSQVVLWSDHLQGSRPSTGCGRRLSLVRK